MDYKEIWRRVSATTPADNLQILQEDDDGMGGYSLWQKMRPVATPIGYKGGTKGHRGFWNRTSEREEGKKRAEWRQVCEVDHQWTPQTMRQGAEKESVIAYTLPGMSARW